MDEQDLWIEFLQLDEKHQRMQTIESEQDLDATIAQYAEESGYDIPGFYIINSLSPHFWRRYHHFLDVDWMWLEVFDLFGDRLLKWYFQEIFPTVSVEEKNSAIMYADKSNMGADTASVFVHSILNLIEEASSTKAEGTAKEQTPFDKTLSIVSNNNIMSMILGTPEWEERNVSLSHYFWLYSLRNTSGSVFAGLVKSIPAGSLSSVLTVFMADYMEVEAEKVLSMVEEREDFAGVPMEWLKGMFWEPNAKKDPAQF